ncbi:hypothetical protein NF27_GC00020 [Candidatus Jidaibacter acanthamoeba]|uniref:Uncharacterized protein n=1 Tax=Candidatus Jidaibacter acanthamoebae TaxID=86105 RepID=A0A0C1QKR1_9RICK|nr:hypothetical protein [Candidatus Jidaibacter acanthamoeba]KIE04723.1 hypothetical protein NF27_GC00020 [Candidatus Jidaibacter acanthamoeba]
MNNLNTLIADYFKDSIYLLIENAIDIHNNAINKPNDIYLSGKLMAYVEVLSLLQMQAQAFSIPLESLKLDKFEAEKDLLSSRIISKEEIIKT